MSTIRTCGSRCSVTALLVFTAAVVVTTAGAAGAVDAVPLPMKGPPGANVGVNVTNCPAGTTESIAVRFRVAGGVGPAVRSRRTRSGRRARDPADRRGPVPGPDRHQPRRVPFDVFCLGAGNTVVDGPATVPFEVALLPVSVTPTQGPLGTHITVSGSGCRQESPMSSQCASKAPVTTWPVDLAAPDAFRFSAPPAADGSFSCVRGSSDLPLGENSVQVFCISEGGSNLAGPGFGLFIVTESTVATPPLPRTGGNSAALIVAGAALLFVGALSLHATTPASIRALSFDHHSANRQASRAVLVPGRPTAASSRSGSGSSNDGTSSARPVHAFCSGIGASEVWRSHYDSRVQPARPPGLGGGQSALGPVDAVAHEPCGGSPVQGYKNYSPGEPSVLVAVNGSGAVLS